MFSTYQLQGNVLTWPEHLFSPSIHQTCINGYAWSINNDVQGIGMNSSITLDNSLTEDCDMDNVVTIRPRVMLGNIVLTSVTLTVNIPRFNMCTSSE